MSQSVYAVDSPAASVENDSKEEPTKEPGDSAKDVDDNVIIDASVHINGVRKCPEGGVHSNNFSDNEVFNGGGNIISDYDTQR